MQPSYAHFQEHNPVRPVDWRWQRATALAVPGRRCSPKQDDVATRLTVRFVRWRQGLRSGRRNEATAGFSLADLAAAYDLHEGGGERSAELQARVLAGQPAAEIALRMGIAATTVAAYEAVFFAVRERLHAETHILLAAIGAERLVSGRYDRGQQLKLLGFFGGPRVLDAALAALSNPPAAKSSGDASCSAKIAILAAMLEAPLAPKAALKLSLLCNVYGQKGQHDSVENLLEPAIPAAKSLVTGELPRRTAPDAVISMVARSQIAASVCEVKAAAA